MRSKNKGGEGKESEVDDGRTGKKGSRVVFNIFNKWVCVVAQ